MQPWDIAGSLQGSELNQRKIQATDIDAAGQTAAGNALMSMFNSPVPGAQPMAPPGGQPQQPQQGGLLNEIVQRLRGAPQINASAPAPQGGMQPSPVPGAQPMPALPAKVPPSGAPPAVAGAPAGTPGTPQQPGQGGALDWRTVVQSVVRSNPGVKDPRVIAAAVDRFMPIMNQQSQMEWRAVALGIRQQQADTAATRADTAATQGQTRLDQNQQRLNTQQTQGAERIKQGQERIDQGTKREERLDKSAQIRADQGWQRLEIQKANLQRQITQGGQRQLLGQWRAVVDAQHKRAMEIITSGGQGGTPMDATERKKLLDDENKRYEDEIRTMRSGTATGFNNRFEPTQDPDKPIEPKSDAGPVKVKTPEEAQKLSKGTHYITPDGQELVR